MLVAGERFQHVSLVGYTQLVVDEARDQLLVGGQDKLFRLSLGSLAVLEATDWKSPPEVMTSCTSTGQDQVSDCRSFPPPPPHPPTPRS